MFVSIRDRHEKAGKGISGVVHDHAVRDQYAGADPGSDAARCLDRKEDRTHLDHDPPVFCGSAGRIPKLLCNGEKNI